MDNVEADLSTLNGNILTDVFFRKYIIGIVVALIAVLIALYCSNYLKNKSEKQLKETLEESSKMSLKENDGDITQVEEVLTFKHDEELMNKDGFRADHKNDEPVRSFDLLQKIEGKFTEKQLVEKKTIEREQEASNDKLELTKKEKYPLNEREFSGQVNSHKEKYNKNDNENEKDDNTSDEDAYNSYDDDSDRIYNPGLVRSLRSIEKLEARLTQKDNLPKKKTFECEQMASKNENQTNEEGNDDNESDEGENSEIHVTNYDNTQSDNVYHPGLLHSLNKLEVNLTKDQLAEEKRIEHEQMAAIRELLKKQESQLNVPELDEKELNAQLNLYR